MNTAIEKLNKQAMRVARVAGTPGFGSGRRQSGATAVEFAFVFPFLFLLSYAAIVYGYVYMAYQTIAYAAQAGAEAAVQIPVSGDTGAYQGQINTVVANEVSRLTSFLAGGASLSALDFSQYPLVRITVTYKVAGSGLFPTLIVPPFFNTPVPPLPASLTAYGVVTLAPV